MKSVRITTEGLKFGKEVKDVRYTALFSDGEKIISVDNFKGVSDNYMQRIEPVICVFGKDRSDVVFEGTHDQLVALLIKQK